MAGCRSWVLFLTVCAVSVFGANAEIKFTIPVGKLFTYELMRETFQNDFEPLSKLYPGRLYDDPMIFKCNRQNFPDLPEWLRFTQRHPYDNGFLYGTPVSPGKSIIEIYAVNKRSYETARQILVIKVTAEGILPYQAEFFIKLREVEKVLPSPVQDEIKQDLQKLWDTEALEIVNITNALDRGGRVPLPLAGHFEGVYVKVGSEQFFSDCLLRVLTAEHEKQCKAGAKVKIPGECNFCSIPSNCITWCKTELFDLSKQEPTPPAPTVGSGILEAGGDFIPLESPPSRDYLPDYIVTVIVPLILAIILCTLLAYIMCCRREGVAKRNARTNQIQLYHHHTILGNTDELRNMAGDRGTPPLPLSTLPMFNSRTGERASPLRSNSPSIPLIMAQHDPYVDTLPRK
ncbi:alpha-sarcoglycan [Thunnus maccoyii]|uniref:alpha-sarcoglycan n=1 Tax=Thunnus maccoyii TaxID=8240 RepID=UPI001C4C11EC|nr:alpha-sarcoglycan [Thunnus maccoyii]XP_042253952.1 alpha-sarcoglycan [Thunnus maccoyii]XP_042253953.1 alpha-sarcoglycan [Thunnus maccoyii]XP_042253954.1 alpha-sarcoglycan [Thunnus maccoyii]